MSEKLKKRNEVLENDKWKIEDLVPSDDDFQKRFDNLKNEFKKLEYYNQNFNIQNLANCLKEIDKISQEVITLYVYANLKLNEDTTNNFYQALASNAESLISMYQGYIAFFEPFLLNLEEDELLDAIKNDEDLKIYEHYIKNILRNKKHILSKDKEELLANIYEVFNAPSNIYSMINNADMKYDDIEDENGNLKELTSGNFMTFLESPNREVRKRAFKAYYKAYKDLKNTIQATYTASVKADTVSAKIRNYNSSLEAALFRTNVDLSVYKNLINTVHKFLPVMHKYINVRKKRLNLQDIHFYDLYTPIVKDYDIKIPFEKAKEIVLEALKPLGEDYINVLKTAFNERWIDVYENIGKRNGAYVWGAYGCHPFVSLNYKDNLNNMFTLAHEMGHALHSYYTQKNQPFVYGNYTIFLAEVASTVNEALLMEYLLKRAEKEEEKLYLLNYFMEQFRTTLFRQTMFAEFEMIVHEKIEKGESQTFESLSEIYKNLNIKYYGDDIIIDEEITFEWTRIPHFYNAFYVYQYATGYSCAIAFAEKILKQNGAEKYLTFLKSGSSAYSTDILKKAGVDMTKTEPIENALKVFESLIDEMDKIS